MNNLKAKILVLDNVSSNLKTAVELLSNCASNLKFETVYNRQEFLEILEVFNPDLILAVFQHENFNGLQALKLLPKYDRLIPVIIVSNAVSEDNAIEAIRGGAADYISIQNLHKLPAIVWATIKEIEPDKLFPLQEGKLGKMVRHAMEMAGIGGWKYDIKNNILVWSDITKNIFEVPADYQPSLEEAINFYKEGESRSKIQHAVNEAITTGKPYVVDLQIITAKGRELWVSSAGVGEFKDGKCIQLYGSLQDIHEKKIVQEELCETNIRYQLATSAGNWGIWELNLQQDRLVWDSNMYKLYGYQENQSRYLYKEWFDLMHPNDRDRTRKELQDALEGRKKFDSLFRVIHPDGKLRYLQAQGDVFKDEHSQPVRIVGINYDITSEMEQKFALQDANQELNDTLESITDGFIAINKNLVVTHWNKAAETILQKPRKEAIGKNIWESFPHPRTSEVLQEYLDVLEKKVVRQFEKYFPSLDKWFDIRAYPREDGLTIYFRNITREKQQREEIKEMQILQQHVINSTDDMIWAVDRKLNLILANAAFIKVKEGNLEKKLEVDEWRTLKNIRSRFVRKEEANFWENQYKKAIAGNICNFIYEFILLDGRVRKTQISLYPIQEKINISETNIIGVACFGRDVTERINHIAAIEEQNHRLKQIAWIQSHVVRAPLARIMGLINVLKMEMKSDSSHQQFLDLIMESAEDFDRIVRDITKKTSELDISSDKEMPKA